MQIMAEVRPASFKIATPLRFYPKEVQKYGKIHVQVVSLLYFNRNFGINLNVH